MAILKNKHKSNEDDKVIICCSSSLKTEASGCFVCDELGSSRVDPASPLNVEGD